MALSPMKWQRCSTFTPGHAVSTMNAVICRFSFPLTIFDGVRAITTISSAFVPLVHHSFSPFRIHACPSSLGTAMETMAVPSEDGQAWILNGEKLWCTNGTKAELMVVMARTPSKTVNGKEKRQITAVIVETEIGRA